MTTRLLTIVGARPQFVKAATVSRAIAAINQANPAVLDETIVHTGQHYDSNMSDVFFNELDIPVPDHTLGIGNCSHGVMTGRMLGEIERLVEQLTPDVVLVYGDTNSTLAGALAAAKLRVPVAHVEAGLRSFNMTMPEEINRVLTDRISTALFCPTGAAVQNLTNEGIHSGIFQVGDVMYDSTLHYLDIARQRHSPDKWGLQENEYILCTVHRAENTDNADRLTGIFGALAEIARSMPVVLPMHPRTRARLGELGSTVGSENLRIVEPVSYLQMLSLQYSARAILTDSGGMQKEAWFCQTPCITLRDETEWIETVDAGCNVLAGAKIDSILAAMGRIEAVKPTFNTAPYGDGHAAERICQQLERLR